jgi:hypothetical protein
MKYPTPIVWDEDAERELAEAISHLWLSQQLEGIGKLSVDATVVESVGATVEPQPQRQRGTGRPLGRPRAIAQWNDELIAEAQADVATYLEQRQLQLDARGVQQIAASRAFSFLKSKGIAVNEDTEFRTVLRRIVKGEGYKFRS